MSVPEQRATGPAALLPYVSETALSWSADVRDERFHRPVGTLVFADVSGFTALSERLAAHGKVGAEQLTTILNAVFSEMLTIARARGGSLLKFGGDALLLLFTGDGHPTQAASAAVEMRSALARASRRPTDAGRVRLRMSVGLSSGRVDLFLVGQQSRELIISGPVASGVAEMEAQADAGEILLSPSTAALVPPSALGRRKGPGTLLRWRTAHAGLPPRSRSGPPAVNPETLVPPRLRDVLLAGPIESEHRTIGVAFIRFHGLDDVLQMEGTRAASDALTTMIASAQRAAEANDVTLLATDLAPNGGKVILVTGFPTTEEDDAGRLVRTAGTVVGESVSEGWPLRLSAGVNRGHVFAGAVGSTERATITVMGDTVNLAARVMARADAGTVLATPTVLDAAQTLFRTEPIPPFMVKGKSAPVTAYVVGAETGPRPPRGLGALPFIGRDEESTQLRAALADLHDGRGGVLTVVGPVGVGKSRLLKEVTAQSLDTVIEARAEPFGGATPYRPLRDPFRSLLGLGGEDPDVLASELRRAIEDRQPDLLPWLPLLGDVVGLKLPPTPATTDLDDRFRPERTADAVVTLLRATLDRPFVLVVDDAHYVDDSTGTLLRRLEREANTHPLLLLCSRHAEDDGYRPSGAELALAPLSDYWTRELVRAGTQAAPLLPHDVDAVVQRVAGNPLFLEETLRHLRGSGDVEAMPSSLEEMVTAQIDALSPSTRRLVRRASVLGRSFRIAVLRDLFSDGLFQLDEATRREAAEVLQDDGPGRLRFRHALLRDSAYNSLPYRDRQQLHIRAAQSVLARAEKAPEAYADYLALHYSEGGDARNTWRWARIAAEQARATYANDDAAAHYRRAIRAAATVDGLDPEEITTLHESLGDVMLRSGEYTLALQAYRTATRSTGSAQTKARLLMRCARAQERGQHFPSAYRELTRARRLVESRPDQVSRGLAATVDATRAHILCFQDRFLEARRQSLAAVEGARAAGSDRALATALVALDTCSASLGRRDRGDFLAQALPIYQRLGDLEGQSTTTSNLGAIAYFDGRWQDAVDLYRAAIELADRIGDVSGSAVTKGNLGEILVNQGRYEEAEPVLLEARQVLRSTGLEADAGFVDILIGRIMTASGRHSEAESLLADVRESMQAAGQPDITYLAAIAHAETLVAMGQPRRALALINDAAAHSRGSASLLVPVAAYSRVLALQSVGRADEAAIVAQEGIAAAREQNLVYERARLEQQAARLGVRMTEDESNVLLASAEQTLTGLGVTRPHV